MTTTMMKILTIFLVALMGKSNSLKATFHCTVGTDGCQSNGQVQTRFDISTPNNDAICDTNDKLISVDEWGDVPLTEQLFKLCGEFTIPSVAPILSKSMDYMFFESNPIGDINHWDVSGVTTMMGTFYNSTFNSDISGWNVSSVTDMGSMFSESSFNGNISKWDVGSVTNMISIFYNSPFDGILYGGLSEWDVSSVEVMESMFLESPFTGDVSKWEVGSVVDADNMFYASPFDGDISGWGINTSMTRDSMFTKSLFTCKSFSSYQKVFYIGSGGGNHVNGCGEDKVEFGTMSKAQTNYKEIIAKLEARLAGLTNGETNDTDVDLVPYVVSTIIAVTPLIISSLGITGYEAYYVGGALLVIILTYFITKRRS